MLIVLTVEMMMMISMTMMLMTMTLMTMMLMTMTILISMTGSFKVERDILAIGTPTTLLAYDVENNSDLFYKEVMKILLMMMMMNA